MNDLSAFSALTRASCIILLLLVLPVRAGLSVSKALNGLWSCGSDCAVPDFLSHEVTTLPARSSMERDGEHKQEDDTEGESVAKHVQDVFSDLLEDDPMTVVEVIVAILVSMSQN